MLSQLDARVDEGRRVISEQVADHDRNRRDQGGADRDRDVDPLNHLPGELAQTAPAEAPARRRES